ncbi:suppressor of hpr1 [Pichia californica]|nr:suppressor of hpr1 [[Candida] californica]
MTDQIEDLPTRWEIELEFVQSLANTQYLTYLAQLGYLKDETFLNYLNYLNYWKDPKFSKFLVYPNCLHILSLLQFESFRNQILNSNFTNLLFNDMLEYWKEPLYINEKDNERECEVERDGEKVQENEKKLKSTSISTSTSSSVSPNLKLQTQS